MPALRLAVLLLSLAPAIFAAGMPWHWVKTSNIGGHSWDVSKGDAEVEIADGKINATLYWEGSTKLVRFSLKGSLANGVLTVKEIVYNSDFSGSTYNGKLLVQEYKGLNSGKTEVITLSDGNSMIGLTRATSEK